MHEYTGGMVMHLSEQEWGDQKVEKPELVAASQAVPGLACGARASDPAILAPNAYTSPRAEPKGREGRGSVSFGCTHNQIAPE